MSRSREIVLDRVRAALADAPARADGRPGGYARERQTGALPAEQFCAHVRDYGAQVFCVAGAQEIAPLVARRAVQRGARRLAIPPDLPVAWRPGGVELCIDDGLTAVDLDAVDGALTGCAVAMAETGTIALDSGPAQGRRLLTLVPDWHVCVVHRSQLVAGVPEGLAVLADAARAGRPITLIAGPSATSDIELQRIEGVHGPRTLDVLLV